MTGSVWPWPRYIVTFIPFVEVNKGTETDVIYFDTSVVCIHMLSAGWNTVI